MRKGWWVDLRSHAAREVLAEALPVMKRRRSCRRGGGEMLADRWRDACRQLFSSIGLSGVWAMGPISLYFMFYCLWFLLVNCGFMPVISPYRVVVGRRGLGPGLHTLCALSALARRRVPCFVKWSQPPSGRMKLSVTEIVFRWQHSGKADRNSKLWLRVSKIFLVCHHLCKANRVANDALFANWCSLEYIFSVETLVMISGCSLYAYCNLGFKYHVPPCILRFH
ncbi:hypothetical protein RchiOBHm_Chr1g0351211 [Rosa chinensis]|uniref:Uncharacterized protein n=1 Tax=Rosa chinensis TaxID=74649 RepID=A0A2P6SG92_ROSCH|nr:hypothetical protein RchiOBHm_Chr1g0351211 [Rosa chinensis]